MKALLLDQNISPRLVEQLADIYPDAVHVSRLGMGSVMDIEIWRYAHDHDFIIFTKDADFSELGMIMGFQPKVIWIRRGNCSTQDVETILRENYSALRALSEDSEIGILTLF